MNPIGPSLRFTFPYDRAIWPNQVDGVCQLLESEFPGNPIDCAIVFKGSIAVNRHIENRGAFLRSRTKTKLCRFTLNNHFSCVAASGSIGPRYWGQMGSGGTVDYDGRYVLMVFLPPGQTDVMYAKFEQALLAFLGPATVRL